MSNILILNQPAPAVGLNSFTYTVLAAGIYNVQVQLTVPSAIATGAGAGSGSDQGLGMLGGTQGIGQGSNLSLGNGGTGLGFGAGTSQTTYNTSGSGHGAGAGGGDAVGMAQGGNGLGDGGVGQGFGPVPNNYKQPIANVIVPSSGPAVASTVSIVVAQNSSTKYTTPALTPTQSAQQFKYELVCQVNDVITITPSSSTASDETLNGVQWVCSIGQGQ